MELAGLKVVMDADFSAVYAGFKQAEEAAKRFQQNTANIFKSVTINPDALAGAGKATEAVVKAQKEASAAIQEANVQWRNQAGTINNALSQNERYKAELAQVRRELKLTSAGQKDAAGNLRTVSSEVVNLRLREAQLKQAISENNISVRSQTKEMLAAHGSMVQLSQELGQMRTLYRQLSAEERNSPFGRQLVAQIKQADAEIKRLDASIGNHQRNVGNYASAFNPLNHNIAQITREFPAFANSMQTGFMAISNNIPLAVDSMRQFIAEQKQLQAQGKPSKTALQGLAGAIFSWNTALSAAITLSVVYGPKLIEMAKNGWKSAEAIKEQKERQEALNEAVSNANKEAAEQISRLRVLSDTMQNANLTMGQRTAAYNEAVKMAPIHLSNLSKEEALTKGLANRINNELVPAIMAAARARAYEQKIQIAQERLIDLEIEQNENLRKRAEIQKSITPEMREQAKRAAEIAKLQAGSRGFGSGLASTQIADEIEQLERSNIALNENARERIALNKEIEKYGAAVQRALTASKGLGLDTEKIGESVEAVAESSKEAAPAVDDMAGAFERMTSIRFDAEELREYMRQVIAIVDEANRSNTDRLGIQLVSKDSVYKSLAEAKSYVSSAVKDLAGHFQKQTTAAFMGLGETIGNAFNGQNFDIVSGIIGVLGDQLKQLGAYLIEVGVTKEAIEKALSALGLPGGGAGVVIAGVAAIALGQVLKNAAQKRMQNLGGRREFAAGGVVYGPTNALVGEYRGASSNPEVIAPLDKLTNILRSEGLGTGNMQPIVLTTRIDGQDLLLSQERAKKWRDR